MTKKINVKYAYFAIVNTAPAIPPVPIDIKNSPTFTFPPDELPEFRLERKLSEKETRWLELIILGWRVVDTRAGDLVHHEPRWQVIDPDGFAVDYQPTEDEAWASAERMQRERAKEQGDGEAS